MMKLSKNPPQSKGFGIVGIVVLILTLGLVTVVASVVRLSNDKSGLHLALSNGCKDTDLTLQPVEVKNLSDPITLRAKLTVGGKPIPDQHVTFYWTGSDTQQHTVSNVIGYGRTDSGGVAIMEQPRGLSTASFVLNRGGTIAAVQADFADPVVTKKDAPFYCGSKDTYTLPTPLTVKAI